MLQKMCEFGAKIFKGTIIDSTAFCAPYGTVFPINPLPNDKILNGSKLKAFADGKITVTKRIEICFGKDRKHGGKRRKCW